MPPVKGKPKGGKTALAIEERRRQLRRVLEETPVSRLNVPNIAKQMGVSPGTLYADLKALREQVPKEEVENFKLATIMDFEKLDRELRPLFKSRNDSVKLGALRLFADARKERLALAQRLGLLEDPTLGAGQQVVVIMDGFDASKFPRRPDGDSEKSPRATSAEEDEDRTDDEDEG